MALLTDSLHRFEARASDDVVKTDLELICTECDTVVCDIEHGDNLKVLASVADDHVCAPEDPEDFPQTPEEARVCVHNNLVWFGHECGICDGSDKGYVWKEI